MPDDPNPPGPSSATRPKPARTTTTGGTVRSRTSPPPGSADHDSRPPTKRARKAINCEPCRNSKLKCDRNRPCSSCVLRGTIALCYQDARGHESEMQIRSDDSNASRVDPMQEITRLRHSVSLLETYILANHRPGSSVPQHLKRSLEPPISPSSPFAFNFKKEPTEGTSLDKDDAPGMLGSQGHGGLYAGPTAAVTHLTLGDRQSEEERHPSQEGPASDDLLASTHEYDRDLLALLPSLETIDGLVSYYFEYCNWIYRHVNQTAFLLAWARFKSGANPDRVVLATVCMIMAIAVHYLPPRDPLIAHLAETHEELGKKFYDVMRTALDRHRAESRSYSLEMVECLLIRCHYLTLSKTDSEEIWTVRGELVSMGMAMGLHRDPLKWRLAKDVAERRRWAWWHIVLLERWQAFMFGRPLAFASHHFDTQLPAHSHPTNSAESRLYLPNIALFRLAYILGDIMDNAVSLRAVPYESVLASDRALTQWMDTLPPELDLDEFRIARSLASPNIVARRLGVQSVIIRTSYYHIRFTLHRPYASSPSGGPTPSPKEKEMRAKDKDGKETKDSKTERQAQSLEIAVGAADKLITLVGQARPDFLANVSLAVPGHMNWGPFHVFSAAMFFSFQLIANPDQPGASLFRANIRKAITTLELSRGAPVADKALDILHALAPLYNQEFVTEEENERERKKSRVLGLVKTLAFPYHDSLKYPRVNAVDSPGASGGYAMSSPGSGNSSSPHGVAHRGSIDYGTTGSALGRPMPQGSSSLASYAVMPQHSPGNQHAHAVPSSPMGVGPPVSPPLYPVAPSAQPQSQPYADSTQQPYTESLRQSYTEPPPPPARNPYPETRTAYPTEATSRNTYPDPIRQPSFSSSTYDSSRSQYTGGPPGPPTSDRYPYVYQNSVEEDGMWGASLSQAEWVRFLDVMQRPAGDRA
ncbi:fungal-specific transcription factor domain-containing protein [Hygrophoropsis aurantiaca]|uniref:Fungal-specific transcription factor domain-containing protein n=1 Tax=Hygrophoropsis aurantiaca TaxID=72124 RepID=A0ACB8ARI6_9AGAM|nr:fungal-specific transcription factor domain-containing protein [Hygrophoropsis aurantiaca]